jgi:hypothetical protein
VQLCQSNNLKAIELLEGASKMNTWTLPPYMTLINNVAENWEEENDNKHA